MGPVSHYMIRYGTSSGSYEHSVLDVGNTNIYEVKDLLPNVKYYFQVAGVNGCQPGDWSNEITPREAAKVLGAVTHEPVAAGSGDVDFSVVATATAAAGSLFLLLARVTRRNYILDL